MRARACGATCTDTLESHLASFNPGFALALASFAVPHGMGFSLRAPRRQLVCFASRHSLPLRGDFGSVIVHISIRDCDTVLRTARWCFLEFPEGRAKPGTCAAAAWLGGWAWPGVWRSRVWHYTFAFCPGGSFGVVRVERDGLYIILDACT